ncbi:MAG: nitroreductase family protein [Thermoanaerobaculia bacterium]|nr:nitroreductase family protein [Thermoanaerobaculia bacterium]
MSTIDIGVDELLTTTRAVRKRLDLDRPVDMALVRECLDAALQAPSGSNAQGWHFVVVTDADKRRQIGELYAKAFEVYRGMPISAHTLAAATEGSYRRTMDAVVDSAEHLAAHLGEVPVHLIPCIAGRIDGASGPGANLIQAGTFGSILPAVWSFMLAARARGLGTAWTTLHLMHEKEVAEILDIPYDEVTQVALVPVAHYTGTTFRRANRRPLDDVLHLNRW